MNYFYAFLSGFFSFASPCTITLIPFFLSFFISSKLKKSQKFYLLFGILFGVSAMFSILSFGIFSLKNFFIEINDYIRLVGGFALALTGTLRIFRIKIRLPFQINLNPKLSTKSDGFSNFFNGVVFGILLGSFWTPCQGPFVATIALLIQTESNKLETYSLMGSFIFGMIFPMILIGFFATKDEKILEKPIWKKIENFSNYFLIFIGWILMLNLFGELNGTIANFLEFLGFDKIFEFAKKSSDSFFEKIKFTIDFKKFFKS